MTKRIPATLHNRLKVLEAGKQRRQPPMVAFYHVDVDGDAEAAVERHQQLFGRPPAVLLPCNGRGDK